MQMKSQERVPLAEIESPAIGIASGLGQIRDLLDVELVPAAHPTASVSDEGKGSSHKIGHKYGAGLARFRANQHDKHYINLYYNKNSIIITMNPHSNPHPS